MGWDIGLSSRSLMVDSDALNLGSIRTTYLPPHPEQYPALQEDSRVCSGVPTDRAVGNVADGNFKYSRTRRGRNVVRGNLAPGPPTSRPRPAGATRGRCAIARPDHHAYRTLSRRPRLLGPPHRPGRAGPRLPPP